MLRRFIGTSPPGVTADPLHAESQTMTLWQQQQIRDQRFERVWGSIHQDHDALVVTSPTGERRLRAEARHLVRDQLFRSSEESIHASTSSDHDSSPAMSSPNAFPFPPQRSPPPVPQAQTKLDVATVVSLFEELKRTASPDELAMIYNAVMPVMQDHNAFAPEPTSPKSPTHRRSFFSTSLSREKRVLRKSLPTGKTEPQSLIAQPRSRSLMVKHDHTVQERLAEIHRTATPDLAYLGAHAIGSLRVTNGAPSPEPSIHNFHLSRRDTTRIQGVDEYFASGEASRASSFHEGDDMILPVELEAVEAVIPTVQIQLVDDGVTAQVDSENNLFYGHLNDRDSIHEISDVSSTHTGNVLDDAQDGSVSGGEESFHMYSSEASSNPFLAGEQPETTVVEDSPTRTSSITDLTRLITQLEVETEPQSPETVPNSSDFAFSRPLSTMYEESISELVVPATPQSKADLHRGEALEALNGSGSYFSKGTPSVTSSFYSTRSRKITNAPPVPRPVQHLDSGYGSQTSVHSVDHKTPAKAPSNARFSWDTSPTAEVGSTPLDAQINKAPEASTTELTLVPASRGARTFSEIDTALITRPRGRSDTALLRRTSTRKLQKKRRAAVRHSSGPLLVQSMLFEQTAYGTLPSLPAQLVSRHVNRLSRNPGMEHLAHTFKSVSRANSRESHHSKDLKTVKIVFPSSPSLPAPRRSIRRSVGIRRHSAQFLIGKSRAEHRPRSLNSEATPIGLADLGTVASTLGASPYDLARGTSRHLRNASGELPAATGLTSPYQLGSEHKTKRLGMDDRAATEFAMLRSRDRKTSMEAEPAKPQIARRPSHRRRTTGISEVSEGISGLEICDQDNEGRVEIVTRSLPLSPQQWLMSGARCGDAVKTDDWATVLAQSPVYMNVKSNADTMKPLPKPTLSKLIVNAGQPQLMQHTSRKSSSPQAQSPDSILDKAIAFERTDSALSTQATPLSAMRPAYPRSTRSSRSEERRTGFRKPSPQLKEPSPSQIKPPVSRYHSADAGLDYNYTPYAAQTSGPQSTQPFLSLPQLDTRLDFHDLQMFLKA